MKEKEKDWAKEEEKITYGFEWQEFFAKPAGRYLWGLIELEQGLALKQANFDKIDRGENKGQFKVQTLGEFERHRGQALMCDRFFDIVKSGINSAKRKEQERREMEEKSGDGD